MKVASFAGKLLFTIVLGKKICSSLASTSLVQGLSILTWKRSDITLVPLTPSLSEHFMQYHHSVFQLWLADHLRAGVKEESLTTLNRSPSFRVAVGLEQSFGLMEV